MPTLPSLGASQVFEKTTSTLCSIIFFFVDLDLIVRLVANLRGSFISSGANHLHSIAHSPCRRFSPRLDFLGHGPCVQTRPCTYAFFFLPPQLGYQVPNQELARHYGQQLVSRLRQLARVVASRPGFARTNKCLFRYTVLFPAAITQSVRSRRLCSTPNAQ